MPLTKTCTRCLQDKTLDLFSFKSKKRGTYQPLCKGCHKTYRREHYLNNRDRYLSQAADKKKKRGDRNRAVVMEHLRTHPCVDCGESDPVVLEFDHVRGRKRLAVCAMNGATYSVKAILEEIGKCEVRCANCHRRKTYRESSVHGVRFST